MSQLDKLLEDTLAMLRDGMVLSEVAGLLGMKRTTLYMRFAASEELLDAYTRAREEGLMVRGENLVRKIATAKLPTLATGGIDPAAVSHLKLEVEAEKWLLAKLHAKIFGDKQQVEHSGTMTLEQLVAGSMKAKE